MLLRCISIHAPLAGRDGILREGGLTFEISIHAPLAGRDYAESRLYDKDGAFQSTRPSRGATKNSITHQVNDDISIHAPLAGRDAPEELGPRKRRTFQSTRPSRGATTIPLSHYKTEAVFQSTRPSRGATMARDTATLQ